MGKALYRAYRPKKLAEIVGQEHITDTLEHALKQGTISHAYLFTGPRGVGKTSIARILAHEVNGLEYSDDSAHLDIIEIDAASNRRIDEIRELRERVHITPTSGKYKVYIIDEVHMLTREAFNALLKTLEEPPAHVIFILATTEAHKLPETIVSRTQRFSFKPLPVGKVVTHLQTIAKQEKIKVDDEALEIIAEFGEGSFRDSINILDQARNQMERISTESVQRLLGIPPAMIVGELAEALAAGNKTTLVATLVSLREQGFEAAAIAKQLAQKLRQQFLDSNDSLGTTVTLGLLKELLTVPASPSPAAALELALLSATTAPITEAVASVPPLETATTLPAQSQSAVQPPQPPVSINQPDQTVKSAGATVAKPDSEPKKSVTNLQVLDETTWPQVLAAIQKTHSTLYGILRMSQPTFHGDDLELGFSFAFHQKRLADTRNRQIVAETIEQLTGQKVTILSTLQASEASAPATDPKQADEPPASEIDTISNIFGGAELLE